MCDVRGLDGHILPALLPATCLGCFLSVFAALLVICLMNLAFPTYWSIQHSLTSYNGLSMFPCKDSPVLHQASVTLLNHGSRCYNPLTHVSFMTLKTRAIWMILPNLCINFGWILALLHHSHSSFDIVVVVFLPQKISRAFSFYKLEA